MSVPLATPCSFRSVCLVSKRLYRLCCVPEMLRELDVNIAGERALQRAQALLAWLPPHAKHVGELMLLVHDGGSSAAACSELAAAVSSCLAVIGAVGQLEHLVVHYHTPLPATAWLPTMRSLQEADLGTGGRPLRVTVGAHLATGLQSLYLRGSPVTFEAAARLPPSLTFLFVRDDTSLEMPAQVSWQAARHPPSVAQAVDIMPVYSLQ